MALRKAHTVKWPPRGLTDAIDAGSSFPGAMAMLANLIPAQNQKGLWVPRPGSVFASQLPDYGGGPVTALITVGNMAYGMYASAQFGGKDRPFVFNMATGNFSPINGMASGNLPTSQSVIGDWTPPTVAQVGTRIIFTHPGFPGGTSQQPAFLTFQGTTHSNTTLDGIQPPFVLLNAAGQIPAVGQQIIGPGIPSGTTISAINAAGTSITLSQAATSSVTAQQFFTVSPAPAVKFGWLDISNFSQTIVADTFNGVAAIIGNFPLFAVQPGMVISGAGIPANTTVEQAMSLALGGSNNLVGVSVTTGTSGATILVVNNQMIGSGMLIAGAGITPGSSISGVALNGADAAHTSYSATLSLNATQTLVNAPVTLTGSEIILSAPATASASGVMLTITGGDAPLWGAGDTNINPLAAVPIFVAQFSGRAYYGVNTTAPNLGGVTASDSGIACQVSQASQVITFNDGVFVTAAQGLALFNQLGGIIQSLMVFQGESNIRQITGDFALNTWAQNSLLTAIGTLAPNAIAATPRGLLFAAPDGLRLIDFDARVSDPIGVEGDGLVLPFTNAVTPSRMVADFNANVYRLTITWLPPVSVQNVWGAAQRTDEFWFHLPKGLAAPIEQGRWSGPHASTLDQIAPWSPQDSFLIAPMAARGFFYRGDVIPTPGSAYVEFGAPLNWTMTTPLLPDDEEMMMNAVGRSSILSDVPAPSQLLASATDDHGNLLAQGYAWGGPTSTLRHLRIGWNQGFEFRQASFSITGPSSATIQLGTMAHTFQRLGKSQGDFPIEFVLGQSILGGPDVLGP